MTHTSTRAALMCVLIILGSVCVSADLYYILRQIKMRDNNTDIHKQKLWINTLVTLVVKTVVITIASSNRVFVAIRKSLNRQGTLFD